LKPDIYFYLIKFDGPTCIATRNQSESDLESNESGYFRNFKV